MLTAITVSTSYSDLVPLIIESNIRYFERWIFVTDKNDCNTIEKLKNPKIEIIYFDFKNNDRIFDKGGAVRRAQELAYKKYPRNWNLLLDSDICLSTEFEEIPRILCELDEEAIYGSRTRHDFTRLSDFLRNESFFDYPWGDQIQGYFQLYKKHYFYKPSMDASWCDLEFLNNFEKRFIISGFSCRHLGKKGHWTGRMSTDDFIFDC